MKHAVFTLLLGFMFTVSLQAQHLDTLVDVGGYKLHFSIIKGEGTPILFEPGGTFDGPPWNGTLDPIYNVTGTTLITYDRSGFGKSELNPNETDPSRFGILNGMEELETALAKLGYDDEIILVGHSYGAFYSLLYAARHPEKVKYVVLVNAQLAEYWTDERLAQSSHVAKDELKPGDYYLRVNFPNTVKTIRQNELPPSIPAIDLVAGIPIYFMTDDDFKQWKKAHSDFSGTQSNRVGILIHESGHYIFKDNPVLFVNAVIKAYTETLDEVQKARMLNRVLDMNIKLANEAKKMEME